MNQGFWDNFQCDRVVVDKLFFYFSIYFFIYFLYIFLIFYIFFETPLAMKLNFSTNAFCCLNLINLLDVYSIKPYLKLRRAIMSFVYRLIIYCAFPDTANRVPSM